MPNDSSVAFGMRLRGDMKKYLVLLPVFLALAAACSNPLLKWIETPAGSMNFFGSIVPPGGSDKAITSFSFGIEGESVVIQSRAHEGAGDKIPITVVLPIGSDINSLAPPAIEFIGKSISPPLGIPQSFYSPVTYTVTAQDGTTQDYEVEVIVRDPRSAEIIWFDLELPGGGAYMAEGFVVEGSTGQAGEIILHVPSGTDPSNLTAKIVQTGASIEAPNAFNTRMFSGTSYVTLTGDFSSSVRYTVNAEDGSTKIYDVKVIVDKSSAKEITAFSFAGITGADPAIIAGVPLNDGKYPIVITVPEGIGLSLTPQISFEGDSLTGEGVAAGGPGTVTAAVPVNFDSSGNSPVSYTVTAENGSTREYAVTVFSTNRNSSKQITGFYFFPNTQGAEGVSGIINETARTIVVTVPVGTDLSALRPTIYHTGASVNPLSGAPADFSNSIVSPVPYTVTARNGSTQTYMVSVYTTAKRDKEITTLDFVYISFSGIDEADTTVSISPMPDDSGNYPVEVIIPTGHNLNSLTPVILYKGASISGPGNLSVSNEMPAPYNPDITGIPATTAVDFAIPQIYTVTAKNGQTRSYTVIVREEEGSNIKKITGFYFVKPTAVGYINDANYTITVKVPYGTNLSGLVPTVFYKGVSLDPASGMARSFNSPAVYTVKARNGTSQAYTVTVQAGKNSAKEISAITFPNTGVLDTVIGAAPGPDGKIPISVTVSQNTSISSLAPKITHTGASITPPGGGAYTTPNPYTDISRNFSTPQTYQITAEDGSTKDYAVSVHISGGGSAVITGFVFKPENNSVLAAQTVGAIDQTNCTITVALPRSVGSVIPASLRPTITYIGASIAPPGGTAQTSPNPYTDSGRNFSGPLVYRVTALDGTFQDYTVTVVFEEQNLGVAITFQGITDPQLISESYNQGTGIITLILNPPSPYGPPYKWRLDGKPLNVSTTEPRLELQTSGLQPGQHEIVVAVHNSDDNLNYTNKVYFMVSE
jgi:hypothetical protein